MKIIHRYFSIYQICIYAGSLTSLAMNLGLIPYWRRFSFFELMVPMIIPLLAYALTLICAFCYGMMCGFLGDDDI